MVKFRCLVVDHDDTAVDSTPTIHHPIYKELMGRLRPDMESLDLRGFRDINNNGGVVKHYLEDLGFSDGEILYAKSFWMDHPLRDINPPFFEGFLNMLGEYKGHDGIVAVVSHSDEERIREHYTQSADFIPDDIYGSDLPRDKNKPEPWPLEDLMEKHCLNPEEIAVLDDMMPGHVMADHVGAYKIGAGWAIHDDFVKQNTHSYFDNIEECRKFIMDGEY